MNHSLDLPQNPELIDLPGVALAQSSRKLETGNPIK